MDGKSSDGLVFIQRSGDSGEVTRARLSDGALLRLTATPTRDETWPYWSDGAGRLVYQVSLAERRGITDLVLWGPEAGEVALTETPDREERWPTWSPDGDRLVYAFRGGRPAAGIMAVDIRSGTQSLLARSGSKNYYLRPNFAPDGIRMVSQRRHRQWASSELWILTPGIKPRRLTGSAGTFDIKAWYLRDGHHVIFSRGGRKGGPRNIIRIADDGSDLSTVASTRESDDHSARPSPTRDEFVFVSDRGGSQGIYVAPNTGGPVRLLIDDPDRSEFAPRWSPDGNRVVLTYAREGSPVPRLSEPSSLDGAGIQVVDRDGAVLFESPGLMPDWMPPWR